MTTEPDRALRVLYFHAENFARLKVVDFQPDRNAVVIAGRNASGKSSTLNAVWMALQNKRAAKEIPEPVRHGQKKASVYLELGDDDGTVLQVERTWTEAGGTSLKVTGVEGRKYSSPQSVLDDFIGALSFDPMQWLEMTDSQQVAALVEVVDLDFDLETVAVERKELYDERTDVRRELKKVEGQLAGIPKPNAATPEDEVSVTDALAEFRAAQAVNHQNEIVRRSLVDAEARCESAQADVDRLKAQLSNAFSVLSLGTSAVEAARLAVEECPPDNDLESIQAAVAEIEETNKAIRDANAWFEVDGHVEALAINVSNLDAAIEAIDTRKRDALANAKMPLDGLGFDDEGAGVTFNGVSFRQASGAERLRVAVSLAIAANPTLRVIRITDASLLDDDSMELLKGLAVEHDVQLWIEVVGTNSEVGVLIEDGEIAE